jgi:cytochrome c553
MDRSVRHLAGAVVVSLVLGVASVAVAGPLDGPGATKALTCTACHGEGGQSLSNTMPILSGMWPVYFKKAIADYAAGKRPSTEMEPYAKMVVQMGVDDVAAYFSAQPRAATAIAADPAAVVRGGAAAQECLQCHKAGGGTIGAVIVPDLRGQPPGYLLSQMRLFKQDRRSPGDPNLTKLKEIMRALPDATLADLAAYWSQAK